MIRLRPKRIRYRPVYALTLLILTVYLGNWHLANRRQQYTTATNQVYDAINWMSSMENVFPNKSTVILEPSNVHGCQQSSETGLFLLLMVISSPENVVRRNVIRLTFSAMQPKWEEIFLQKRKEMGHTVTDSDKNNPRVFQLLFFVGQPVEGEISNDLRTESEFNGDLVVDSMLESYLNLTVKTLRMLKWARDNCGHARYLVKLDDDVFLHMPKLFTFLLSRNKNSYFIAGDVHYSHAVFRYPGSKWFSPESLYSSNVYPSYVAGFCYIMGMPAAQQLLEESENLPLYHLEDIYLSGLLAKETLHYKLIQPGEVVDHLLWYHYLLPLSWPQSKIIVHEVKENHFRCWMKQTGNQEESWSNRWWPWVFSCK